MKNISDVSDRYNSHNFPDWFTEKVGASIPIFTNLKKSMSIEESPKRSKSPKSP